MMHYSAYSYAHFCRTACPSSFNDITFCVCVAHQRWCWGLWPGSGLSWFLSGGIPQRSVHRVSRPWNLQLLRQLLQLLAGHHWRQRDVYVRQTFYLAPWQICWPLVVQLHITLWHHCCGGYRCNKAKLLAMPNHTLEWFWVWLELKVSQSESGAFQPDAMFLFQLSRFLHIHILIMTVQGGPLMFFSLSLSRKPVPTTLKAGSLRTHISRCQVCMKRT